MPHATAHTAGATSGQMRRFATAILISVRNVKAWVDNVEGSFGFQEAGP